MNSGFRICHATPSLCACFASTGSRQSSEQRSPAQCPPEAVRLVVSRYPCREAIVINGGAGFSTTGDVRDSRLGLSIPVILAGVVEGSTSCHHGWRLTGELPGGRFKYSYRQPSPNKWGLHFLDIDLGTSHRPAVDISLVTGQQA
ncbi:Clec16a [Symbiodinium natans]|uniref:Clec16a protein n=1 Tax=Symbiodinium natans TaxID=878477 RepID=A0A812TLE6_9DINO|nr:Clec16a [Symbiodinium natans]